MTESVAVFDIYQRYQGPKGRKGIFDFQGANLAYYGIIEIGIAPGVLSSVQVIFCRPYQGQNPISVSRVAR
jgi:hypothetical protein